MKCPYCNSDNTNVTDTRTTNDSNAIRRRRECGECKMRFTTYERVETVPLMVVKKDLSREPFSRDKLIHGLMRACQKRPVSRNEFEFIASHVENKILNSFNGEIPSNEIGLIVLDMLKDIDEISYVRFASVYRSFEDIEGFIKEIRNIRKK